MRTSFLATLTLLFSSSAALAGSPNIPQPQRAPAKKVDLVIALDTSSSMDGLIDGARAKLWDVVNLLARAQPQPTVRVGLISYGNDGYDARGGWVRKDAELTTNLDAVYAKLFALRTNGGSEYVARAVHEAARDMAWDQDQNSLKIIFVAGNEGAEQDPKISLEQALGEARDKNIFVNTIYCGSSSASESAGWQRVAQLGKGEYAAIDHNRNVAVVTPMDAELSRLSNELNKTYVGYGGGASAGVALQATMDKSSSSVGAPAAASRAQAKASALYRNDDWDLVDARAHGKKKVAEMPAAELPEPMRAMDEKERTAYLDGKAKDRVALQKKIVELSQKRDAYIAEERKKEHARGGVGRGSLDDAMTKSIKSQGEARGLAF
jgi:hypothetical protein